MSVNFLCHTPVNLSPKEEIGCEKYRRLGAHHAQSHVVDKLLYTQYTSERTEFRNFW